MSTRTLQAGIVQVDDLAAVNSLGERAAEDERNPCVHLHIRGQPGPAQVVQRLRGEIEALLIKISKSPAICRAVR